MVAMISFGTPGIASWALFFRREPDGFSEQDATREFVGRGLAAFLQKPFVVADLGKTLEAVLATGPSPG